MTTSHSPRIAALLAPALLGQIRARAPHYDATNSFFADDLAALQESGYLTAPVPTELGGSGLTLTELVVAQRLLAAHAPATALGVNMHLVWVQVAAYLRARGDHRLEAVLRDSIQGELFAFGISEAGNDAVLLDARTTATPDGVGGYSISGTKTFTTLSPVWTRLGVHARVVADALAHHEDTPDGLHASSHNNSHDAAPKHELVFGFVHRSDPCAQGTARTVRTIDEAHAGLERGHISHPGTWNMLGMRATHSYTTQLDQVPLAASAVAARFPAYDASDPLVLAIFSSFSLLTAAVYAGIADRALELATEAAHRSTTLISGEQTTKMADPDTAARLTAAALAHRQSLNTLELLARDVDELRTRDDWFVALAAARNQITDEAHDAVTLAMRVVGAASFRADSELARLGRDVLAGLHHPSSPAALARSVRAGLGASAGEAR